MPARLAHAAHPTRVGGIRRGVIPCASMGTEGARSSPGAVSGRAGMGTVVNKLVVVGALSVVLALTGCSKGSEAPAGSAPASTSATTTTSPTTSTTSTTTTTSGPTTTGSVTTTAPRVAVDQSTPEAAMTSWLKAMFAGDKEAVCALMASGGKAIADVPNAVQACSDMIGSMLDQLKPLADAFQGLTIEGATVSGDTATFESVTTTPPTAAQIVKTFKAVRIGGKWYITQG